MAENRIITQASKISQGGQVIEGLDQSTSQEKLLLTKSGEDLIIKQYNRNETTAQENSGNSYVFRINSFYTLLENDQLNGTHNGFQTCLNKIKTLDLSNCGLKDLPKCLKILGLKTLNLSNNNLKQVPSCLYGSGLKQLENLNLSNNQITIFDIEPDCINNLKTLKLNNNNFENVPKWFLTFRCINLEEFNYSENKALNYDYLKNSRNTNLMKIKKLVFMDSCLLDKDFNLFRTFHCLEYLDISNKINNQDTRFINKFRNFDKLFSELPWKELKVLKLDNLGISILPENLLWLESIVELYLGYNVISWIPEGFAYLSRLEVLDISYNGLVSIQAELIYLTNLKLLKAAGNHLEDCPKLPQSIQVLDLYDNIIYSTVNLDVHSPNLKYVDMEYNYCDMSEFKDSNTYMYLRELFREAENLTDRVTCPKNIPDINYSSAEEESHSSSSLDYDIDEQNPPKFEMVSINNPQEDWDNDIVQEKKSKIKHPDVTLSDNEWQGEEINVSKKYWPKMYYPCEEDWIYADVDD